MDCPYEEGTLACCNCLNTGHKRDQECTEPGRACFAEDDEEDVGRPVGVVVSVISAPGRAWLRESPYE